MDIILNCIECGKRKHVEFIESNNMYVIECCDTRIENQDKEELINEWNNKNNKYYYIFGVMFSVDMENESTKRELDGLINYDQLILEKFNMFKHLLDDELFKCDIDDVKKMFPECVPLSYEVEGLNIRKSIHQPGYKLYKFSTTMELTREDIEMLVKNLPKSDLDKYELKFNSKNIKGLEVINQQTISKGSEWVRNYHFY